MAEFRNIPNPNLYAAGRWLQGYPGREAGPLSRTLSQGAQYAAGGIGNVLERMGSGQDISYMDALFGTLDLPAPGPAALKAAGTAGKALIGGAGGAGLATVMSLPRAASVVTPTGAGARPLTGSGRLGRQSGIAGTVQGPRGEPMPGARQFREQPDQTLLERAGQLPPSGIEGFVHAEVPARVTMDPRYARVTPDEKRRIRAKFSDPAEIAEAEAAVRRYKAQHPVKEGWQPIEARTFDVKDGKPVVKEWGGAGYDFHINPATGKPWVGEARDKAIVRGADSIVADVENIYTAAKGGDVNALHAMEQARWYKDAHDVMVEAMTKVRGGLDDAPGVDDMVRTYGNLQGAFSPNTALPINFRFADEFSNRALRGDFDRVLPEFKAHVDKGVAAGKTPGQAAADFTKNRMDEFPELYQLVDPDDPTSGVKMKKDGEPARYGMNTHNGLLALADMFEDVAPGSAPKMRNYAGNFTGRRLNPTIDVWAGRGAQTAMGRPRVPPAINAIAGSHSARPGRLMRDRASGGGYYPAAPITGPYGFAHDMFTSAAQRLGMEPRDLQALKWFHDKFGWERAGWTPMPPGSERSLSALVGAKYGLR